MILVHRLLEFKTFRSSSTRKRQKTIEELLPVTASDPPLLAPYANVSPMRVIDPPPPSPSGNKSFGMFDSPSLSEGVTQSGASPDKKRDYKELWSKIKHKVLGPFLPDVVKFATLKMLCVKDKDCLDSHPHIMNSIFDFLNFSKVVELKRIGAASANGFVHRLTYKGVLKTPIPEHVETYTILKSSANEISDNLSYEYFAGLFVNSCDKLYPCFLHTYGMFKYTSKSSWSTAARTQFLDEERIQSEHYFANLKLECSINCLDAIKICEEHERYALLLQYIEDPISLHTYIHSPTAQGYDLMCILFIVYMALDKVKHSFTHYDLHSNNILLFTPYGNDKYIEYTYHLEDGTDLRFSTIFAVKIIDYGRSYYEGNDKYFMKLDHECGTKELQSIGFDYHYMCDDYYICSRKLNVSSKLCSFRNSCANKNLVFHSNLVLSCRSLNFFIYTTKQQTTNVYIICFQYCTVHNLHRSPGSI